MTTANEGMELTRVGPGTVMGELMRCYWIPAAMSSELARDGAPRSPDAARREADRLSRQRRPGRRHGPSLPAPLRVAVPRPQRGGRHSLHLPRLEVRRRRQLPRYAEPAAAGLQAEGEGQGLQGRGARRRRLGLHGLERRGAAAAGVRDPRRARGRDQGQLHPARLQLSAGARGRDRHLAFRLPARRPRRSRTTWPEDEPVRHTVINRAPEYHLAETPWGTQYAGYREAGPGQTYWRFGNFLFPFWTQAPNGEFGSHMHARAWVPLDDEPHHVLLHLVEAGGVGHVAAAAGLQGRHADRRHRPRQQDAAQHHRLARPLADGGRTRATTGASTAPPSRATRSTAASTASTCRTRPSPRAWADRRPHLRASGAVGPDDHAHAPTPADGGARAARQGRRCRPASRTPQVYRGARSGYFVSDDEGPWQEVYARQLAASVHPQPTPLRAAE